MKALLATATLLAMAVSQAWSFDQSHAAYGKLLEGHVVQSGVKYAELKKEQPALKTYLNTLATVSRDEFGAFNRNEQLAFLINLYNATTLDVVLDHYPIKSFKDEIGGDKGPWKIPTVRMMGSKFSLDDLEHKLIRERYEEPRIHFALNCASDGCPPLRNEPFVGDKLEEQLEEQTKLFLADRSANSYKNGKLKLSPIFDWFKVDFIKKSGSVQSYVNSYFPEKTITKANTEISYSDYGWGLNDAQ